MAVDLVVVCQTRRPDDDSDYKNQVGEGTVEAKCITLLASIQVLKWRRLACCGGRCKSVKAWKPSSEAVRTSLSNA